MSQGLAALQGSRWPKLSSPSMAIAPTTQRDPYSLAKEYVFNCSRTLNMISGIFLHLTILGSLGFYICLPESPRRFRVYSSAVGR